MASELTYGEEYAWGNRPKKTQPAPVQLSDLESSPKYSVSVDGGTIRIVSSSRQIIPIVSDTVAGYVDFWSMTASSFSLAGGLRMYGIRSRSNWYCYSRMGDSFLLEKRTLLAPT